MFERAVNGEYTVLELDKINHHEQVNMDQYHNKTVGS